MSYLIAVLVAIFWIGAALVEFVLPADWGLTWWGLPAFLTFGGLCFLALWGAINKAIP